MHKIPQIPVVLNAWECEIHDGRHFANSKKRTFADIRYGRVIDDLRSQICIVVCIMKS